MSMFLRSEMTPGSESVLAGEVLFETLSNIRTVASLTLEEQKSKEYNQALCFAHSNETKAYILTGVGHGIGQLVQMVSNTESHYANEQHTIIRLSLQSFFYSTTVELCSDVLVGRLAAISFSIIFHVSRVHDQHVGIVY